MPFCTAAIHSQSLTGASEKLRKAKYPDETDREKKNKLGIN